MATQAKDLTLGIYFNVRVTRGFERRLDSLRMRLASLSTPMQGLTTAAHKTKASMTHIAAGAETMRNQLHKASSAMTVGMAAADKFGGALHRVGTAFKIIAAFGVAGFIIGGFTRALRGGIQEIVDFDQALKNLQAITEATDAELAVMGNTLIDIATRTKFSTTELADAMVTLGQAGFSAKESIHAIEAVATLATGTLSEMSVTSDLLTTALRAWNLDAVESTRIADVMANAINGSKLTVDKLRIAFNYVAPSAAQAGISVEQTAAAMMTLANNGLRASTIGTGLRQVLRRLVAPTSRMKEALMEYNINIQQINPSMVGFENALKNLTSAILDHEKGVVDMGKAYALFGLRGAQAVSILVKSVRDSSFQNALDSTKDFGAAARMAAKQAEGLGIQAKRLQDRAKVLAIALGDAGITGAIRGLIQALSAVTLALANFVDSGVGTALVQFGLLTSSLSVVYLILKKLCLLIVSASAGIGGLKLAMSSMTVSLIRSISPWWLLVAGISAAVTALIAYSGAEERAIKKLKRRSVELESDIHSLRVYIGAVKELEKQELKGNNVKKEKQRLIHSIITSHKELKEVVSKTTLTYEELVKAMNNVVRTKVRENIQTQVALFDKTLAKVRALKEEYKALSDKSVEYNSKLMATNPMGATHWRAAWMEKEVKATNKALEEGTTEIDNHLKVLAKIAFESYNSGMGKRGAFAEVADQLGPLSSPQHRAKMQKYFNVLIAEQEKQNAQFEKQLKVTTSLNEEINYQKKILTDLETAQEKITLQEEKTGIQTKKKLDLEDRVYGVKVKILRLEYKLDTMGESAKKRSDESLKLSLKIYKLDQERLLNKMKIRQLTEKEKLELAEVREEIGKVNKEIAYRTAMKDDPIMAMSKRYQDIKDELSDLKKESAEYNENNRMQDKDRLDNLKEQNRLEQEREELIKDFIEYRLENNAKVQKLEQDYQEASINFALNRSTLTQEQAEDEQEKIAKLKQAIKQASIEIAKDIRDRGHILINGEEVELTATEIDMINDKMVRLASGMVTAAKKTGELKKELWDIYGSKVLDGIADGVANLSSGAKSASESFRQMAEDIVKDLMRIITKLLIIRALQSALGATEADTTGFKGWLANTAKGMGFGAIGRGFMGMFQEGGILPNTGMFLGHKGEEVISSQNKEGIMGMLAGMQKNQQMVPAGAGAGQPNVNIYQIHAVDTNSFARLLSSKQSQAMMGEVITSKFSHNSPIRKTIRRGY